ncbi:MAG: hypothetical protein M3R59_01620 [Verrucomicrobiota bacterium]|nr:hypothetical protein [Verrucomicrobiota bacterium]
MHLDLGSVLNLISTVAIVGALVFTALQVRGANQTRRDQAAIVIIQTTQDASWTQSLNLVSSLPENATMEQIRQQGDAMERALFELGIRLEPVGYMIFCRIITLNAVDDLVGGVAMVIWSRAKAWTEDYRKSTNNPKFNEWVEWLADRLTERRARLRPAPAPRQYRNWRER